MINLFTVTMPPSEQLMPELEKVLYSGYIGQGPKVEEFEKAFGNYIGTDKVLSVNSGTSALHLALRLAQVEGGEVITTPMTCLSYLSPVLLADGTTKAIGHIVNQRLPLEVLSRNTSTGLIEAKKVVGWIKLPAKSVEWFRLNLKNSRGSRGPRGKRGIWLTGDHEVLTRRGYQRVDSLLPDDEIATREYDLRSDEQEFVDGTLLGDGYLQKGKRGMSRFGVLHSVRQSAWVNQKRNILRHFSLTDLFRAEYKQSGPVVGFQTSSGLLWEKLRKRWYSQRGKKIVPDDLRLTPRVLATWYMDDGSLNKDGSLVLCTDGFELESTWKLFWKMTDLGFRPRIYACRKGHRIEILRNEADRFFGMIGSYILPSMRYKVPETTPYFDVLDWYPSIKHEAFYDGFELETSTPPPWHKPTNVYCLEVEDNHNFISADMVLKNCTATNWPILANGADIVWADIDPETGMISPQDIARKFTDRTRAIMVVHWGGTPANLGPILEFASEHNVPVIEDAAHALGGEWYDRKIGNTGSDYTCFIGQTMITTDLGRRRLTSIKVGDRVRTASGTLQNVLAVQRRSYAGDFAYIAFGSRGVGVGKPRNRIISTVDHPVRVFRNGRDIWLEAGKIQLSDEVYVETSKCKLCDVLIPFYHSYCLTCHPNKNLESRQAQSERIIAKRKDRGTKKGRLSHFFQDIAPRMAEYQKNGYRVIPTIDALPDFIAIKDDRILAVEVQNSTSPRISQLGKYNRVSEYYDDVIWICQEPKASNRKFPYTIVGDQARVGVVSVQIKKRLSNRGTPRRSFVYNLTVENDPTYFAAGLLVHNCFSFQAIKHITTVDGGMLVLNSEPDYKRGKLLRWYGIDREGPRQDFRCEEDIEEYGYKFHMNDVNATIGLGALPHLEEILDKHRHNASFYNVHITNPSVKKPVGYSGGNSAWWLYTLRVPDRDSFMQHMKDCGVMTSRVHARNDTHSVVEKYRVELPGVDKFESEMVCIPVHSKLTYEELQWIATAINKWASR